MRTRSVVGKRGHAQLPAGSWPVLLDEQVHGLLAVEAETVRPLLFPPTLSRRPGALSASGGAPRALPRLGQEAGFEVELDGQRLTVRRPGVPAAQATLTRSGMFIGDFMAFAPGLATPATDRGSAGDVTFFTLCFGEKSRLQLTQLLYSMRANGIDNPWIVVSDATLTGTGVTCLSRTEAGLPASLFASSQRFETMRSRQWVLENLQRRITTKYAVHLDVDQTCLRPFSFGRLLAHEPPCFCFFEDRLERATAPIWWAKREEVVAVAHSLGVDAVTVNTGCFGVRTAFIPDFVRLCREAAAAFDARKVSVPDEPVVSCAVLRANGNDPSRMLLADYSDLWFSFYTRPCPAADFEFQSIFAPRPRTFHSPALSHLVFDSGKAFLTNCGRLIPAAPAGRSGRGSRRAAVTS
jgi:hypothetical protein